MGVWSGQLPERLAETSFIAEAAVGACPERSRMGP